MKIKMIMFLAILLLWTGCEKKELPQNVVSTVGDKPISYDEFLFSYLTMPKHPSNITEREARLQQMDYLNDRMHLFLSAEADGLGESPDIMEKIDYIRNRETLKYLYRKEIWEQLPVTDDEAWAEYKRENIEVKVRHLFAESREQAQQFYDRLQNGESFESLAGEAFQDSVLAANGGDLGWLTVTSLDPLLVDSVYNARLGMPTQPLQSSFGWHVMKVEDIKQNVFLSRDYFEKNKETYVNSLRSRRATRQSQAYVKQALTGKTVTIKGEVLTKLLQVNQTHLRMQRRESPLPAPSVDDLQLLKIAR
ncbi:MAG: peptidylprolyl isomerase, partial [Calditrichaeota bacterium]|nr:peptidylprolyl isomerase [Calditrichota bacterium]